MKFFKQIIKRPVTILMVICATIIFGVMSINNMPISLLPNMQIPIVAITTEYMGTYDKIESEVTEKVEDEIRGLAGVDEMLTISMDGASLVILQFEFGLEINDKINEVRNALDDLELDPYVIPNPDPTTSMLVPTLTITPVPQVVQYDVKSTSVATVAVTNKDMSLEDLASAINEDLIYELQKVNGVANVKLSGADGYAFYNGENAILLDIYAVSGGNTTDIVKGVKSAISAEETLNCVLVDDQALFIESSISGVWMSLIIGGILSLIIIILFLGNVRSSIIVGVAMPLSIVLAMIMLYVFNVSLNLVSLGGLAVGIGMLVDNSIVCIENIHKKRDLGLNRRDAAVQGASEIAGSILASTLTSIAVFLPILFIQGITKEIFRDLSLSVCFSLIFSLVVALTLIPASYALVGKRTKREIERAKKPDVMSKMRGFFAKLLEKCLKIRWIIVGVATIIFASSVLLVFSTGMEFLPMIDNGKVSVTLNVAESDLDVLSTKAEELRQNVKDEIPQYQNCSISVGKNGVLARTNSAQMTFTFDTSNKNPVDKIAEKIREIAADDNTVSTTVVVMDGIISSLGITSNVSISVCGENLTDLEEISGEILEKLETNPIKGARGLSTSVQSRTIQKENGYYYFDITCENFGVDSKKVTDDLVDSVNEVLENHEGYFVKESGVSSYLTSAFEGLFVALFISIFLVFAVIASQFESLKRPFVVLLSVPFALTGGILALVISNSTLNVVSFIGIIMLVGVIVNNAIVMIDRIELLRSQGMEKNKAIIQGAGDRLRPIFMTTFTTVLALFPIAFDILEGSALLQPLAIAVIGGLLLGTLVTLILTPIFYSLIENKQRKSFVGDAVVLEGNVVAEANKVEDAKVEKAPENAEVIEQPQTSDSEITTQEKDGNKKE